MDDRTVIYGRTDSWDDAVAKLAAKHVERYGTLETNGDVTEDTLVQYTVHNDVSVVAEVQINVPGPKRRKQIVYIYAGFTIS